MDDEVLVVPEMSRAKFLFVSRDDSDWDAISES